MHVLNKSVLSFAVVSISLTAALSAPDVTAKDDPSQDADKLMIVDCMLPGKVMRLGSGARYMSARRPIKTTGADCEIRGGEYVAYDRASYASSLKVWLPQAKEGDPKAQTYVGEMFEQGLGTTPDHEAAVAWYRKAAEQGYDRAQMNLGSMYERGLGVPQDEVEALNWYRRATGLGEDDLVLSSEVEALEAETEELRQALAASEAEVSRLKNSLDASRREIDNSRAQLDNTMLRLEEMRYIAEAKRSSGGSSADVALLNEQIRAKEAELAAQREELMGLQVAYDRQQTAFAAQLQAQDDGQSSSDSILDLERQKIADLERQVAGLTDSLSQRQTELEQSNAQLGALRRQLEAQAANDQAAAQASMNELTAIIEQQKADLAQKTNNINSLKSTLNQQQQILAAEQNAYQQREHSLQQSSGDTTELRAELARERSRIAALEGQVAGMARELELKQSNLDQTNSQIDVLNRQFQNTSSQQASSQESMAELQNMIAAQQSDLEQKALSIGFLEQELANQKQQLSAERVAFEQREQQYLQSQDVAQVEKQALESRLARTQEQLASYQEQLVESDRLISSQQSEIQQQQQEVQSLRDGQAREEARRAIALEADLGEKSIQLLSAQGENTSLKRQIEEYQLQLQRMRNQLSSADVSTSVAMRGPEPLPITQNKTTRNKVPGVDFGDYHALIIGNNEYSEFPDLETPINDARAMERVLKDRYGFKTQVLINADRYAILQALNVYRERLTDQDNFLIYYAGHGTLDERNDRGHWLPVDASPNNNANWISNVSITDIINTMSAKHIMVVADSCYSGTLARRVRSNLQGGAPEQKAAEYYRQFSQLRSRTALTSGGTQPVMDGGGGGHSIFANSLLRVLESNTGILQGPDLFIEVHEQVTASGMNAVDQIPAFDAIKNTDDLGAPFFFVSS
jgi:hypothetical protein